MNIINYTEGKYDEVGSGGEVVYVLPHAHLSVHTTVIRSLVSFVTDHECDKCTLLLYNEV